MIRRLLKYVKLAGLYAISDMVIKYLVLMGRL